MTRSEALAAWKHCRLLPLDFSTDPIEAGMGGCPWRIAVASIVGLNASKTAVRVALPRVFARWHGPGLMAEASLHDLGGVLTDCGVNLAFRKARHLLAFCKGWTGDEWETILDLPHAGRKVVTAIVTHARKGLSDAEDSAEGQKTAFAGPTAPVRR